MSNQGTISYKLIFQMIFLRTYLTEVTDNIQLIRLKFQTDKCNQNQNQLKVQITLENRTDSLNS